MSLVQKVLVQRCLLGASGVKGLWCKCKELLVSKSSGVKGFATVKTFLVRNFLVLCERLLLLVCVKAFLARKAFVGKRFWCKDVLCRGCVAEKLFWCKV